MRKYIILLALFCMSCRIHTTQERTVQGYTYDRVAGERLIGTIIYNLTQGTNIVSDSTGSFTLTANLADSIRFKYIGMKDSVIIISKETPPYLEIGLDTADTRLIDNGVYHRETLVF